MQRFLALVAFLGITALALAQTDEPAKPKRYRISAGVAQSNKIHDVQPEYPPEARKRGISGDVLLQVTIDTKGNLINIKPMQGDPILVEASIDAVKKWRYRPYKINDEPVEVETTVKVRFYM
jgi:periplasmic protein TonB